MADLGWLARAGVGLVGEGSGVGDSLIVIGVAPNAGGGLPVRERLEDALAAVGTRGLEGRALGGWGLEGWELSIEALPGGSPLSGWRQALFAEARARSFDVGVQRASARLRPKRLAVFDMDSTLISIEGIDELAKARGVVDQVAPITARAMRGEIGFHESLVARVALLEGLEVSVLEEHARRLPLNEGAAELVEELRRQGCTLAVVSGGFEYAAEALRRGLGLDRAYANRLEIRGGKLTGGLLGVIVDSKGKAALLRTTAEEEGIPLEESLAVGDGANDVPLLETAGLGIAFRAKPRLLEVADAMIEVCGLQAALFFAGFASVE